VKNARQGFCEWATFLRLLDHLPDEGLRNFVEWAGRTAMRKGEIAALTWAGYDRESPNPDAVLTLTRRMRTQGAEGWLPSGPPKPRSRARFLANCPVVAESEEARRTRTIAASPRMLVPWQTTRPASCRRPRDADGGPTFRRGPTPVAARCPARR
jgi:hypothetical protein